MAARSGMTKRSRLHEAPKYAHIAIGHFGKEAGLVEGSRRVVVEEWRHRVAEYDQGRWAYLFGEGLVDEAEADAWADDAWGEE